MRTRRSAPRRALSRLMLLQVVAALFLILAVGACQTGDESGQNAGNAGQNAAAEDGDSGSAGGAVHNLEGVPDYMVKGDPEAPVTMYEWSDYQ